MQDDWLIWQLADSAFPAGSFAHSAGLESAWQQGRVSRGESVEDFIEAAVTQVAHSSVPLVMATHRDRDRFTEIDTLCDAMLSNHVANRASRTQGQSLLAAAHRIFASTDLLELQTMSRQVKSPTHLAPVFGIITGALRIDSGSASRLFVFCALRGLISSAIRLGIFGPMEGQALQAKLSVSAERVAARAELVDTESAVQTAPIIDLLQGSHDRLYSRLFQS